MFKMFYKDTEIKGRYGDETLRTYFFGRIGGAAIAFLLTFVTILGSVYTVNEGHVGVVKRFSEAVAQVDPGLHFKVPFVDSVEEIEVRTRKNVEIMPVATKEQMRATATVSVNWTVKKDYVLELYKKFGSLIQFEERILGPKLREQSKLGISKYTAEENINNREVVSGLIYENFVKVTEEYPIVLDTLQYEDIQLPENYLKSIDDKQTAKNQRDAEKFRLEKQALEAQQKVNTANAERDATKARADGDAYKIKTVATSEAEAIKIKANALKANPDLIEYQKALQWDGKLPTTVMGNQPGVFMNLK